jgi:hypothetical protein
MQCFVVFDVVQNDLQFSIVANCHTCKPGRCQDRVGGSFRASGGDSGISNADSFECSSFGFGSGHTGNGRLQHCPIWLSDRVARSKVHCIVRTFKSISGWCDRGRLVCFCSFNETSPPSPLVVVVGHSRCFMVISYSRSGSSAPCATSHFSTAR